MEAISGVNPIEIPFEWTQFYNQPGYFVTYYGDIYHGFIVQHGKYDDRFFILSLNQAKEFRELKPDQHTLENYQRLAWEIRDRNIIKFVSPHQDLGITEGRADRTRIGNQIWKRMFIFGAGASTHCLFGPNKDQQFASIRRPPLGGDIFGEAFDDILHKFEGALLSVPVFESKGRDIEGCLEEEWLKLRHTYNPNVTARHISIQFYLQHLFHWISSDVTRTHTRSNLYSLFANKLQSYLSGKDERIAIASFNYDTILDHFIEKIFHTPFKQMHDYIDYNNRQILLFKPHGSCNWGWPVKYRQQLNSQNNILHEAIYEQKTELWELYYKILGEFNSMVYKNAWGMESGLNKSGLGRYTVNKNKIEIVEKPLGGTHFPALLMPYRDKDEFVMPYDHHHAMRWYLNSVEELYFIGWKGNEDVFNRLIQQQAHHLKKIIIVNPLEKKEKEVSKNLERYLDLKKYQIQVIDTFETFVIKEMDKIFM